MKQSAPDTLLNPSAVAHEQLMLLIMSIRYLDNVKVTV